MQRIIEILDRIQQGFTEAVFCRAADGHLYVVKTRKGAGSYALSAEWMAGRIGQALGLPIPPIEQLYLDSVKARLILNPDAAALAEAPSFGSWFVDSTVEFSAELNTDVTNRAKALVLLFDWWVMNQDRSAGNPNLLWVAHEKVMHVIDHNLAFDKTFDEQSFWAHHLFRESHTLWDARFKAQILEEMRSIMKCLPDYWSELPPEWTDTEGALTLDAVEHFLRRAEQPAFWNVP